MSNHSSSPGVRVVALFHDPAITEMEFPSNHPMRPERLALTMALIDHLGLRDRLLMPTVQPATASEMSSFHSTEYIEFLQNAAKGIISTRLDRARFNVQIQYVDADTDCPFVASMWDYASRYVGASLCAARLLSERQCRIAINWMGGMHHACSDHASGFCYINDIVLAIHELLKHFKRVLYLDIDCHHGDGVEIAFEGDKRVVTLSIHQFGRGFFPGTGDVTEIGVKPAKGYCVNIPLPAWTTDHTFVYTFKYVTKKLIEAFDPEVIVLQCGADSVAGDLLGNLNVSSKGHAECVRSVLSYDVPVLMLGGGGYTPDNVARTWAFETAVALNMDNAITDEIPDTIRLVPSLHNAFHGNNFFIPSRTPNRSVGDILNDKLTIDVDYMYRVIENSLNVILKDRQGMGGRIVLASDRYQFTRIAQMVRKKTTVGQGQMQPPPLSRSERYFGIQLVIPKQHSDLENNTSTTNVVKSAEDDDDYVEVFVQSGSEEPKTDELSNGSSTSRERAPLLPPPPPPPPKQQQQQRSRTKPNPYSLLLPQPPPERTFLPTHVQAEAAALLQRNTSMDDILTQICTNSQANTNTVRPRKKKTERQNVEEDQMVQIGGGNTSPRAKKLTPPSTGKKKATGKSQQKQPVTTNLEAFMDPFEIETLQHTSAPSSPAFPHFSQDSHPSSKRRKKGKEKRT